LIRTSIHREISNIKKKASSKSQEQNHWHGAIIEENRVSIVVSSMTLPWMGAKLDEEWLKSEAQKKVTYLSLFSCDRPNTTIIARIRDLTDQTQSQTLNTCIESIFAHSKHQYASSGQSKGQSPQ
jgi:hypothetical protein